LLATACFCDGSKSTFISTVSLIAHYQLPMFYTDLGCPLPRSKCIANAHEYRKMDKADSGEKRWVFQQGFLGRKTTATVFVAITSGKDNRNPSWQ
jgi:hypothetical protein